VESLVRMTAGMMMVGDDAGGNRRSDCERSRLHTGDWSTINWGIEQKRVELMVVRGR